MITKAGVEERIGETKWQSPHHIGGIKPQKIFDGLVLGPLTDKQIDRYSRAGVYSNRRYWRKAINKIKAEQALFEAPKKKTVYDPVTQDFIEIDV
jgi:hypothetical protein